MQQHPDIGFAPHASSPKRPPVSPPTLLLVANSSWNLSHFRAGLIRGLRARGFALAAAIPVGDPPIPGLDCHFFPLRPDGMAPLAEMKSIAALIGIMRAVRPAAVLSFTPKGNIYAGLAARATAIPFLPNISGLGTGFLRGGLLLKVQAALYREALRGIPTAFFQNEEDAELFERMGLVGRDQVRLLPGSGVDCRAFRVQPLPSAKPGEARLLFIGRLLGDKGVRELAAAMRLLRPRFPKLELVLVGDLGAANPTAVSAAEVAAWESAGLLRHAGRTADVRPHIAAADAVVLPSYREGMPRALLEAAAMGRPLLAADVPGCRQLVRHGDNGLLFEARSAPALAAALTRFVEAPLAERQAWGASARAIAETRYDERLVIDAYLAAVMALTGKGG